MKIVISLADLAIKFKTLDHIAIVAHYNPDADAYGSSLGLLHALRAAGKTVCCINETALETRYAFLPGSQEIGQSLPPGNWKHLVVLDCGAYARVGDRLTKQLPKFESTINIDHHVSNDQFGDIFHVAASASSTSEIVFEILRSGAFAVNSESANCLLAGIFGDTGSFRYSATSARTFEVAAALVGAGASASFVAGQLFSRQPLAAVKLQSMALAGMQLHAGGKVAEVQVDRAMCQSAGASVEDSEDLAERARDIDGVVVAVSIREHPDVWRISLRSKDQRCDVSTLAQSFGGGGHRMAAAFRWRNSLAELRARLIPALEQLVQKAV